LDFSAKKFISETVKGSHKMPTHKDEDYFIPALAPYVQWVKAYGQLISVLYTENKTVKKAWKAFIKATPGVEERLQFGVFEQILLFSLFLAEWNKGNAGGFPGQAGAQAKPAGAADREKGIGSELDTIIRNLQQTIAETDLTLSNFDQFYEQNAMIRRDQETHFETQVTGLEKNLADVIKEIESEDEHLEQLISELVTDGTRNVEAARNRNSKPGLVQSVIQWAESSTGPEIVPNSEPKVPLKKIGRWNAQRSRDGYYRLYRKIRGRVYSIYIGKELDVQKAERKIADRERELLENDPGMTGSTDKKGQMKIGVPKRAFSAQGDDN